MELNKLYFKSCIEVLKTIPDNSIDAFFEDPPFNSTDCSFEYTVDLVEYWKERKRVAKGTTSFIIKAQMPFTFKVGASNITWYRHRWIWEKDKCGNFLTAKGQPLKYTEDILVFSERGHYKVHNSRIDAATYNPQMREGTGKARGTNSKRFGRSILQLSNRGKQSDLIANPETDGIARYPNDIINFNVPFGDKRIHPTQSPVDLWRFLIRTYTNKGDVLFDGYSGSGTIPVAADIEKRNWIACENSEEHYPDAQERITTHLELKKYGYAKTKIKNQPDLFSGLY